MRGRAGVQRELLDAESVAAHLLKPGSVYGAGGQPLNITLGTWEAARGTVALSCEKNTATAVTSLQGLIPGGLYSVFGVHLTVNGAGRSHRWVTPPVPITASRRAQRAPPLRRIASQAVSPIRRQLS